jgi:hypothetical protein
MKASGLDCRERAIRISESGLDDARRIDTAIICQRKEHDAAIVRLQVECERLQHRIHAMYIDKFDGRVDRSFYVQLSEQWRVLRTRKSACASEVAPLPGYVSNSLPRAAARNS